MKTERKRVLRVCYRKHDGRVRNPRVELARMLQVESGMSFRAAFAQVGISLEMARL